MLLICYGTRPEWLKVKSIIEELQKNNINYKTLFTGQHVDIVNYIANYNLVVNDYTDNRLNNITSSILNCDQNIFDGITHILVQGDTTSAFTLALNAFHRKIKIIHLEAGLRTYDLENPYPEEMNRQMISRIADINLCPTEDNLINLKNEGVKGKCYIVGNTVLDNLLAYKDKCEYKNKILVTLHRRENHSIIKEWFEEINKLATKYKDLEFMFPMHPNPNVQKYKDLLTNVKVINPLEHKDLIDILIKTRLVITDSGGLQEECSFFNKRTIVCRKTTERKESIGIHSFLCHTPLKLEFLFHKLLGNYNIDCKCPYGDGHSSKKIIKILQQHHIE